MARKTALIAVQFSDDEHRRFRVRQFKVKTGHAVLERLLRLAAPILGSLVEGLGNKPKDAVVGDLSLDSVSSAFDKFADNIAAQPGLLDWLTEKVRNCTELETDVEGQFVPLKPNHYEDLFAGEYGAELELLIAALKLNFAPLFSKAGGLASVARRFVTPRKSTSNTPKAATPGSGVS
jgi:hypothetical protein